MCIYCYYFSVMMMEHYKALYSRVLLYCDASELLMITLRKTCKDDDHLLQKTISVNTSVTLLVCWVFSPSIVSWWFCRYPERPLSLPECRLTSVPANSGTPYVLFSAKVMLKFSVNFSMTLLKIGHMGYLWLMHGPGYLSTKLSRINCPAILAALNHRWQ